MKLQVSARSGFDHITVNLHLKFCSYTIEINLLIIEISDLEEIRVLYIFLKIHIFES